MVTRGADGPAHQDERITPINLSRELRRFGHSESGAFHAATAERPVGEQ